MAVAGERWSRTTKRVALLVILAAAVFVVVNAGDVVHPFVWAFVVGYVLLPAVAFIERRMRAPRGIAALAVFAALLAAIALLVRIVAPLALSELRDAQQALPLLLRNAQVSTVEILRELGLGDLDVVVLFPQTQEIAAYIGRLALPIAQAAGRFALGLLVFLIAIFFTLRDAPKLFALARSVLPREHRGEILLIGSEISQMISRYIRGQLLLVVIMSTATTIGLTILDLPYAIVLGIATGFLELIPFVGPITAGAIACVVALGRENPFGWPQLVYVLTVAGMYTVFRHAEDYFVIPTVIGRIVRLHPIVVIFSLLAGGALFGLLGVILAVPAAATVRLLLIYVAAKLRDEDPFPQLQRELEPVEGSAPAAAPSERAGGRPVQGEAGR